MHSQQVLVACVCGQSTVLQLSLAPTRHVSIEEVVRVPFPHFQSRGAATASEVPPALPSAAHSCDASAACDSTLRVRQTGASEPALIITGLASGKVR